MRIRLDFQSDLSNVWTKESPEKLKIHMDRKVGDSRNFSYAEDYDAMSLIRWSDRVMSQDILTWHLCALYNWHVASWTDLDEICSSQTLIDSSNEMALISDDPKKTRRVWSDKD